jgi:hypothetical protein
MIIAMKKWRRRLQGLVVILIVGLLLYKVVALATAMMTPADKYRAPSGQSVKVNAPASPPAWKTMWRRLEFFYRYGE